MLSLRTFARNAPRTISRMSATSAMRTSIAARPSTFIKSSSLNNLMRISAPRAFSTTVIQRAADGETDDELSAKLESEIQIEEEMVDQEPASVKDFLDNSSFELIDNPGEEIVKLQRTFGEEKYVQISKYIPKPSQNVNTNLYFQDHRLLLHCRHHQLRPLR